MMFRVNFVIFRTNMILNLNYKHSKSHKPDCHLTPSDILEGSGGYFGLNFHLVPIISQTLVLCEDTGCTDLPIN